MAIDKYDGVSSNMDELTQRFRKILLDNKQDYVLYQSKRADEPIIINIKSQTALIIENNDLYKALICRMSQSNFPIIRDFEEIEALHNSYKKTSL